MVPQNDRTYVYIAAGVLIAHAALLSWIYWFATDPWQQQKITQRLVVQTIALNPAPSIKSETKSVLPAVAEAEKPKKKNEKKEPAKPEIIAAKNPPAKTKDVPVQAKVLPDPEQKKKREELLAKAQESIAKIAQSRDKKSPDKVSEKKTLKAPEVMPSLSIENLSMEASESQDTSYRDEVAARLKLLLRLPEYGEVKVKLTIDKSGKVIKTVIMNAQSKVNQAYIEKSLPELTFPAFSGIEQTFVIRLCNDL